MSLPGSEQGIEHVNIQPVGPAGQTPQPRPKPPYPGAPVKTPLKRSDEAIHRALRRMDQLRLY